MATTPKAPSGAKVDVEGAQKALEAAQAAFAAAQVAAKAEIEKKREALSAKVARSRQALAKAEREEAEFLFAHPPERIRFGEEVIEAPRRTVEAIPEDWEDMEVAPRRTVEVIDGEYAEAGSADEWGRPFPASEVASAEPTTDQPAQRRGFLDRIFGERSSR